jgi:hypothetical protein
VSGSVHSVLRLLCEQSLEERGRDDDEGVGVVVACCCDCAARDAPKDGATRRGLVVNESAAEWCKDGDSDRTLDSGESSASAASESGEDRHCNVDEDGHKPRRRVHVRDASEEC